MRDVFDKCGAFKDDKIAKATGLKSAGLYFWAVTRLML